MPSRRQYYLPVHKALMVLGLILAASVAGLGFYIFKAGFAQYQTRAFLDDWAEQGVPPNPKAWNIAVNAAEQSVALSPFVDNGEYLDNLGRVYEWRHFDLPYGDVEAKGSRESALDAYRRATQARPLWPYTYAQLAFVKLRLLQFDEEFEYAYVQAFELGPWRAGVQQQLAEISFIAWPSLNTHLKELAITSFQRLERIDPSAARSLVKRYSTSTMLSFICANNRRSEEVELKFCR